MAASSYLKKIMADCTTVEFLQLLRLLNNEKLGFAPQPSLAFPAAPLQSIIKKGDTIQLAPNLLSFVGVTSPLPAYFITQIVQSTPQNQCNQNFLQLFNQRLYLLLYTAWKKYRPIIQIEQQQNNYCYYLAALAGNMSAIDNPKEFAFAAAFGQRWQNKTSLGALLKTLLNCDVSIETQVASRYLVQNNAWLGKNVLILADNFLLGEVIVSRNKLNIVVNTVSNLEAMQLLPSQSDSRRVVKYIKRYLGPLIHFDLLLTMKANTEILQLGKSILSLGHSTFISAQDNLSYSICLADKQWG